MYIVPIWEWMGLKKKTTNPKWLFFSEKKISILVYTTPIMEHKELYIKNGLVDFEDLFSSSLTFVKELLNKWD